MRLIRAFLEIKLDDGVLLPGLIAVSVILFVIYVAIKISRGGYWICSDCGKEYQHKDFDWSRSGAARKHREEKPECKGELFTPM